MAGSAGDAIQNTGRLQVTRWPYGYIGIPFVDGGRAPSGCDCWGLFRLVYADQLGIDLPSYGEISAEELQAIADAMGQARSPGGPWVQVERPQEFDACLMTWAGKREVGHIGVCVDGKSILHTEAGINAAIVPVIHFTIKRRIVGYWRHRSRME